MSRESGATSRSRASITVGQATRELPLVSIVLPAYNEAGIIERNVDGLCSYMETLEDKYRWEVILVNDGSTDNTGELADKLARRQTHLRVIHHFSNFGVGQAFQYAFKHCRGDYVVTLDMDLTYTPNHIDLMVTKLITSRAKVVLASPYMKGGKVAHVPWLRRTLSKWANRFLSLSARARLSTLTSMARAYDGRFLRSLNLRSTGMDVMPEIIHKAMMLRARIEEVPACLDWNVLPGDKVRRRSSMRILQHICATLLAGFLFRPFMFFVLPGLGLLLFAFWIGVWAFIHGYDYYGNLGHYDSVLIRASAALSLAYDNHAHTFVIGFFSLMLALQLISLGVLALQSKRYFEEMFHLCAAILRTADEHKDRIE